VSKVLVIDNEVGIADFVVLSLRHEGHGVDHARQAADLGALLANALPDLVLLGSALPDGTALDLARGLRTHPRTRDLPLLLMISGNDEALMSEALDAGADDVLPRPFALQELLARMRAVLLRKLPEAVDLPVEVAGLRLDPSTRRVSHAGHNIRLGPTEFRLLHYLLSHPERVHSRQLLLDRVWGDHVFIAERTVDVHIKRLRKCLVPAGCANLVETVRGAGYRLSAVALA
jgi:two-component system phosphate regulon response regulator PhoB